MFDFFSLLFAIFHFRFFGMHVLAICFRCLCGGRSLRLFRWCCCCCYFSLLLLLLVSKCDLIRCFVVIDSGWGRAALFAHKHMHRHMQINGFVVDDFLFSVFSFAFNRTRQLIFHIACIVDSCFGRKLATIYYYRCHRWFIGIFSLLLRWSLFSLVT